MAPTPPRRVHGRARLALACCGLLLAGCIDVGERPSADVGAGAALSPPDTAATDSAAPLPEVSPSLPDVVDSGTPLPDVANTSGPLPDVPGPDVSTTCEDATVCDGGAGYCEGGACVHFPFALPAGYQWSHVPGGPAEGVPAGCGSVDEPCATGGFRFPLPRDTGVDRCYDHNGSLEPCPGTPGAGDCDVVAYCGQDAQYGPNDAFPYTTGDRFLVEPSDFVRDTWTGLVWFLGSDEPTLEYRDALNWCGDPGGRLPDTDELLSLVDYGLESPASSFPGLPNGVFWTRSRAVNRPDEVWLWAVSLQDAGSVEKLAVQPEGAGDFVLCVYAPDDVSGWPDGRCFRAETVAGEPVVFDAFTGLVWQTVDPDSGSFFFGAWAEALAYCEALDFGGRDDWRLPNVRELRSIVDMSRFDPSIDSAFTTPDTPTPSLPFTTSTPYPGGSGFWFVDFSKGRPEISPGLTPDDLELQPLVRCVTEGPYAPDE